MKKIFVYRSNEYMDNFLIVDVYINKEKNSLPANSSLIFKSEEKEIFFQVKYLWLSSKKIRLNDTENEFKIRILPLFSNWVIFSFLILIMGSFVLLNTYNLPMVDLFFKIVYGSFFGTFIFFITIGCKNYFRITIN